MAGMLDLVQKGFFKMGQNILFVHTGGSPALYHYADYFDFAKKGQEQLQATQV
jgi:1-aminocyclopropane-1-carboxylate deaminase/D-cysteine desulfhydrase-like pyridoxal-dependent ACC family enzyme